LRLAGSPPDTHINALWGIWDVLRLRQVEVRYPGALTMAQRTREICFELLGREP